MKRILLLLFASISISLFATEKPWTVRDNVVLRLNSENGIYAKGDTVRVWADVSGIPENGLTFKTMRFCQWKPEIQKPVQLEEGRQLLFEGVFDESVQYIFEVTDNEKPADFTAGGNSFAGMVVAPEGFEPGFEEPDDLMRFWKREIRAMRKDKMRPVITNDGTANGIRTYHVDINCAGPAPVRAYVSYPEDARKRSLPIIVFLHAAGTPGAPSRAEQAQKFASIVEGGAIGIDVNAHGMLDDQPQSYYDGLNAGELNDYSRRKPELPDYYFKWMMLRAVRIIDYATGNPLWDREHIIVAGTSQGGYQSAWLAGIDPRITAAILTVPAGLDQGSSLKGRPNSWPKTMGKYEKESMEVLPYFDPAAFLKNSKADIWCEIGLYDFTCPAANLFAVMNTIKGEKTIITTQRPHSRLSSRVNEERRQAEVSWKAYFQKAATK